MSKKVEYLTYEELLKKFNEEPKQMGRPRQLQKQRWEKQGYQIKYDRSMQRYEVIPLTKTELTKSVKKKNSNIGIQDLVEPFIIKLLLDEGSSFDDTPRKMAERLGLVNNIYNTIDKNEIERNKLSSEINVSSNAIVEFQKTTNQINKEIIERTFKKLQDKQLIVWEKCYRVTVYERDLDGIIIDEMGNKMTRTYYTTREESSLILNLQNELASILRNESNFPFYALDEYEKGLVYEEVCKRLGYVSYYFTYYVLADKKALTYEFNKKFNALKSKLAINKGNHVRIVNSSRGNFFKELEESHKVKLVNALIDIKSVDKQ